MTGIGCEPYAMSQNEIALTVIGSLLFVAAMIGVVSLFVRLGPHDE